MVFFIVLLLLFKERERERLHRNTTQYKVVGDSFKVSKQELSEYSNLK